MTRYGSDPQTNAAVANYMKGKRRTETPAEAILKQLVETHDSLGKGGLPRIQYTDEDLTAHYKRMAPLWKVARAIVEASR